MHIESTIKAKLKELEQQYGVTVLYACETGSRAWGFPSPDSDYDVRIIYKHEVDWYLSLSDKKDTIEFMSADGELDLTGWDIKKCLQLMWRSNGALLERVQSPIVYMEEAGMKETLRQHAYQCYSPIATMHHYLGMAKKSFADVEGQALVKLKTLFYALRAALACKWIQEQDMPPPIVFMQMVDKLEFDKDLKERIKHLVALKAGQPERYMHAAESELNAFIAKEILHAGNNSDALPARKTKDVPLDALFRQIVKTR